MKLLLITVTLLATAWAQSLSSEYLPPVDEYSGASSAVVESNFLENEPSHTLADDGYRYKTVKRFRLRHRRDVSELSNSYLPPQAESAPAPEYSAPAATETHEAEASEPAPAHSLSEDGYHYRTVKRYRLRRRRDVSELSNSYLPPQAESDAAPAATETIEVEASEPAPAHSLSEDGYHYRAVKRYRLRRRRDVSELSNSYLPPQAESDAAPAATETIEVEASEPAPAHSLSEDGYRYRAVKRYRLRRRRRDVSELSNSYLPPQAESDAAPAATETIEVEASEPAPAHSLSEDGYRYRTVKRYRLRRRRRDVSELSNSYLPPQVESDAAPAATETIEVEASEPAPAHSLSEDGYRYRAVKRYRLRRRRRDVSELSNSYLPPQAESDAAPAATETIEVEASEPAPAHTLSEDGYRYKTVKRYRLRRRRRDVSELSNSYLPPQAESDAAPAATENIEVEATEPAPAHTLSEDGYRYKTVKRYRLRRRRRDVSELSNSYLPPQAESDAAPAATETIEVQASEPAPAHTLSEDGYRYKTVKRYRLRRRY